MFKIATSQCLRAVFIPVILMLSVPAWSCPVATAEGSSNVRDLTAENFSPVGSVQALDLPTFETRAQPTTVCQGGSAGSYPCSNVDLMAFMPLSSIGGGSGNDIWGWTDPQTAKEYALMGRTNGTSFVDISDPANPVYLGNLPTHTSSTTWRDIKVNKNHAYIVSEAGGHGMQVFDLTQLRSVTNPPQTFSNTAHYGNFSNAHNIVMNEDTGFAYAVGTNTCSGGLHMIDVSSPTNPTFAGCYSADGYTHDAQCVTWNGPAHRFHHGSEICFNSNEDTLTIVDVTNKSNPVQLARLPYPGSEYTHQGWLSEDHQYFFLDDELDEARQGHNTKTRVFDVGDPSNPVLLGTFDSTASAIDHNMYVDGEYVFQANYRAGLRILKIEDPASATLTEEAYFDIYPNDDNANFNGAWSVYPYFDSGIVIVSGIESGLFILNPTSLAPSFSLDVTPDRLEVCGVDTASAQISVTATEGFVGAIELSFVGSPAGANIAFSETSVVPPAVVSLNVDINTPQAGQYLISIDGEAGKLRNSADLNLELSTTAPASAAAVLPADGATVVSANQTLHWTPVEGAYRYLLEVAANQDFKVPLVSAPNLTTSSYSGGSLPTGTTLYWRVTAYNACGSSISSVASFTTAPPMCALYESTDVPVTIDPVNVVTVTSNLTSTSSGQVIDVNVVDLRGNHTFLGDLSFQLQGPQIASHRGPRNVRHAEHALVRIIEESCGSLNDFWVSLDDDAPGTFPCPYNDQGTYQPSSQMTPFVGNPGTGDWQLIVSDSYPLDGGALEGWGLEICTTPEPEILDTDGDNIADDMDNCTLIANADQRDTHGDGFGNICDPDLTNNGIVNFGDVAAFRDAFLDEGAGLDADFNGDEVVNFGDLSILTNYFLGPPGPSGVAIP